MVKFRSWLKAAPLCYQVVLRMFSVFVQVRWGICRSWGALGENGEHPMRTGPCHPLKLPKAQPFSHFRQESQEP